MAEYSVFQDWQVTQLSCWCYLINLSIHYTAKRSVKLPNVRAKTNPSQTLVFGRSFGILWMPNVRIRPKLKNPVLVNHCWEPSCKLAWEVLTIPVAIRQPILSVCPTGSVTDRKNRGGHLATGRMALTASGPPLSRSLHVQTYVLDSGRPLK